MFDSPVALTPRSVLSSFEDELRRALDEAVPVTLVAPTVDVELGEDVGWRDAGHVAAAPTSAAPTSAAPTSAAPTPADPEGRMLARAGVWDAQFAAGAAALGQARAAQAAIGAGEAARARALVAFAYSRPSTLDRPDTEIGAAAGSTRAARPTVLAAVSEWAVDEIAVGLGITGAAATTLLTESLRLVQTLPATLAALEAGELTWAHVRVLTELVAPLADDVRAQAEARLLARVAGKTPPQLREAARRVVARLDADALARRAVTAARERGVRLHPGEDGLGILAAVLPLPVARAVHDALARYAQAAAVPRDQRTQAQRMADCLADLVLRPGEHAVPPVQAQLTIVAAVQTLLGGDRLGAEEPGEVGGDLVPAAVVRALAATLGLLPAEGPSRPEPVQERPEPSEAAARRAALAELLTTRRLTGTALAHRPWLALVDELTGSLVALTDATGLRHAAVAGRGLGPPPATAGYRPDQALDRFIRHRDRRCRFPGCRARAHRCDLDHTTPWPHGTTTAANLCCLCRHHHRLSHQAPGWHLRTLPDGGLHWTTPTGQTLTTHPPSHGHDADQLPTAPPSRAPTTGPPGDDPPPGPDHDPPPF